MCLPWAWARAAGRWHVWHVAVLCHLEVARLCPRPLAPGPLCSLISPRQLRPTFFSGDRSPWWQRLPSPSLLSPHRPRIFCVRICPSASPLSRPPCTITLHPPLSAGPRGVLTPLPGPHCVRVWAASPCLSISLWSDASAELPGSCHRCPPGRRRPFILSPGGRTVSSPPCVC